MAMPEPLDDPVESSAPAPWTSAPKRPDWLVGAEDIEVGPEKEETSEPSVRRPVPNLARPDRGSDPQDAGSSDLKARPIPWAAAASSVPQLTVAPAGRRPTFDPDVDQHDDGEFAHPERSAFPTESELEGEPPSEAQTEAAGSRLQPLHEPWWMICLDALATDRRVQAAVLGGLVLIATVWSWPKGQEPTVSISRIKKYPAVYEGQPIRLRGRVGEVFAMGQGYVFHLHQGRDTVVVFTRTRTPEVHTRVDVVGHVTTGYLDGVPRVAVFENEASGSPITSK